MTTTIIVCNAQKGDRETTLDTSTSEARAQLAGIIKEKREQGAAIFAQFGPRGFRVVSYDETKDQLVVRAEKAKGRNRTIRIQAADTKLTVVAPAAGG